MSTFHEQYAHFHSRDVYTRDSASRNQIILYFNGKFNGFFTLPKAHFICRVCEMGFFARSLRDINVYYIALVRRVSSQRAARALHKIGATKKNSSIRIKSLCEKNFVLMYFRNKFYLQFAFSQRKLFLCINSGTTVKWFICNHFHWN